MPPTDASDPIGALFADATHAEALRFALLMAYASGWSDAFDHTPLAVADARLRSAIEEAGVYWQSRLVTRTADPPVPVWLAALQEAHTPEPWSEP